MSKQHSDAGNESFKALRHHDDYYLTGGDLFFLVQQYLFRVHRYFFERESTFFKGELTTPASPGESRRGTSEGNAIVLDGVSSSEFAKLLWVFYNPKYSLYHASYEDWTDILMLAQRWIFPEVKKLAIRELEKLQMPDIERIHVYQEYDVDRRLLVERYAALCERQEPLTFEEGMKLGMATSLMIARARECVRSPSVGGMRSPSSVNLPSSEMMSIIKDLFNISDTAAYSPIDEPRKAPQNGISAKPSGGSARPTPQLEPRPTEVQPQLQTRLPRQQLVSPRREPQPYQPSLQSVLESEWLPQPQPQPLVPPPVAQPMGQALPPPLSPATGMLESPKTRITAPLESSPIMTRTVDETARIQVGEEEGVAEVDLGKLVTGGGENSADSVSIDVSEDDHPERPIHESEETSCPAGSELDDSKLLTTKDDGKDGGSGEADLIEGTEAQEGAQDRVSLASPKSVETSSPVVVSPSTTSWQDIDSVSSGSPNRVGSSSPTDTPTPANVVDSAVSVTSHVSFMNDAATAIVHSGSPTGDLPTIPHADSSVKHGAGVQGAVSDAAKGQDIHPAGGAISLDAVVEPKEDQPDVSSLEAADLTSPSPKAQAGSDISQCEVFDDAFFSRLPPLPPSPISPAPSPIAKTPTASSQGIEVVAADSKTTGEHPSGDTPPPLSSSVVENNPINQTRETVPLESTPSLVVEDDLYFARLPPLPPSPLLSTSPLPTSAPSPSSSLPAQKTPPTPKVTKPVTTGKAVLSKAPPPPPTSKALPKNSSHLNTKSPPSTPTPPPDTSSQSKFNSFSAWSSPSAAKLGGLLGSIMSPKKVETPPPRPTLAQRLQATAAAKGLAQSPSPKSPSPSNTKSPVSVPPPASQGLSPIAKSPSGLQSPLHTQHIPPSVASVIGDTKVASSEIPVLSLDTSMIWPDNLLDVFVPSADPPPTGSSQITPKGSAGPKPEPNPKKEETTSNGQIAQDAIWLFEPEAHGIEDFGLTSSDDDSDDSDDSGFHSIVDDQQPQATTSTDTIV